MSNGYAHSLLNLMATSQEENWSIADTERYCKNHIEGTEQNVRLEGYDFKDLINNANALYTEFMTAVHEGDYEKAIELQVDIARDYANTDFYKLTSSELKGIGFWNIHEDLHLIPIYLKKAFGDSDRVWYVEDGTPGTLRNAQIDIRNGFIPYGIQAKAITT